MTEMRPIKIDGETIGELEVTGDSKVDRAVALARVKELVAAYDPDVKRQMYGHEVTMKHTPQARVALVIQALAETIAGPLVVRPEPAEPAEGEEPAPAQPPRLNRAAVALGKSMLLEYCGVDGQGRRLR